MIDHNPPLFHVEDINKFYLLHEATMQRKFDLIKYFIKLDPSSVNANAMKPKPAHFDEGTQNRDPIHYVSTYFENENLAEESDESIQNRMAIFQHLLASGLSQQCYKDHIGHLFLKKINPKVSYLTHLERLYGKERIWDCIEKVFSSHDDVHKMDFFHQVIIHCPENTGEVMKRCPKLINSRDENNRLPIDTALSTGMQWFMELSYMIAANTVQLQEVDPLTKCPPFALAAASCDLKTMYTLYPKMKTTRRNDDNVDTPEVMHRVIIASRIDELKSIFYYYQMLIRFLIQL